MKKLSSVISFIGFAFTLIGFIIDMMLLAKSPTTLKSLVQIISLSPLYLLIGAAFAVCLLNSDKSMTKNVGYALAGVCGTFGLIIFLDVINLGKFLFSAFGLSFLFVAALIYFVYVCICFFGSAKKQKNDSVQSDKVGTYKELQQEKVLSESEYETLKESALSEATSQKVSVDDLKRWKKLLDRNLITEEEFATLKSKAFGN